MSNPLKVLIVEDDALLRSGLELIIASEEDMEVSGAAQNGLEAVKFLNASSPDIVLMDVQMPEMDGLACIREIRKRNAELPILILTTFNEEEYIFQGLADGANGYLIKGLDFEKLVQAIRDTVNHQFILPAQVAAKVAKYAMKNNQFIKEKRLKHFFETDDLFSETEHQIIAMLLQRLSNKEMGDTLFFTEGTIKNKLTVIYDKLGVNNRQDAIHRLENSIMG
ncbi:response regulator transcription factor [Paenibacillus sp. WQ 127069]|uniref:Response regulator transcription factor n=1 Tax=Paenibacillus baimaensis TaxID=2982185 RepID=A0ABT2UDZ5_9BACL|nr:response regulator transcription factor [Paenibacillus sp. WQ 127069]MCU6792870.1 response regulator transcription factor [Paenibacillus sp. WQ 127069]